MTSAETETVQEALLRSYFLTNGLLLCNENKTLPSLFTVGGDWNSIVSLIERGEVFYSKLFKGRVTYLSRAFYQQIKPYRQRTQKLPPESQRILALLREAGSMTTPAIKNALLLSGKAFAGGMQALFSELLVTAIARDRTMNESWSSFVWGAFETWERAHPLPDTAATPEALRALVGGLLAEKEIVKLLQSDT